MAETSQRMWDLSDFLINTARIPQPLASARPGMLVDGDAVVSRVDVAMLRNDRPVARRDVVVVEEAEPLVLVENACVRLAGGYCIPRVILRD